MRVLYLSFASENLTGWRDALARQAPWITLLPPDYAGPPEDVDAAMVWTPQPGRLAAYPRLRAIFSLGAGIEHIWNDPQLPDVPIVKMANPAQARLMCEYVLYHVLRYHRGFDRHEEVQRTRQWQWQPPACLPQERRVTILGLGELGLAVACALRDHGFRVAGWSRSAKQVEGIDARHGNEALSDLLADTEILVNILPLTPATEGILDRQLFAALPKGAALIQVGRGRQLVEADLLEFLDAGHLRGATLDVFATEPLPPEHPFWIHPRIVVTPHNSAHAAPLTAVPWLVENLERLRDGKPLLHAADRAAGY